MYGRLYVGRLDANKEEGVLHGDGLQLGHAWFEASPCLN